LVAKKLTLVVHILAMVVAKVVVLVEATLVVAVALVATVGLAALETIMAIVELQALVVAEAEAEEVSKLGLKQMTAPICKPLAVVVVWEF
jgi:hypothetical protein